MSGDDPFTVGATVQVDAVNEEGELVSYRTRIEDRDDRTLAVQLPYEKGVPVRFTPQSQLVLLRQVEGDQFAYAATVEVVQTRPGNIPLLVVTRPVDYELVPRRRFFRCPVRLPVRCQGVEGEATNLSGSGLLAVLPAQPEWKTGTEAELELALPGQDEPMPLKGRVMRVQKVASGTRQAVAFDFVHLRERAQDLILRYLFLRQRELISKGLLVPERRPPTRESEEA